MSTTHLQFFLKDFNLTIAQDNAPSHSIVQPERKGQHTLPCRRNSDPLKKQLRSPTSEQNHERRRRRHRECRWQSAPLKSTSNMVDLPPVLTRRVEGPILTLRSLNFRPRQQCWTRGDSPPTPVKRSTEEQFSLEEILSKIDMLILNDGGHGFSRVVAEDEPSTNTI